MIKEKNNKENKTIIFIFIIILITILLISGCIDKTNEEHKRYTNCTFTYQNTDTENYSEIGISGNIHEPSNYGIIIDKSLFLMYFLNKSKEENKPIVCDERVEGEEYTWEYEGFGCFGDMCYLGQKCTDKMRRLSYFRDTYCCFEEYCTLWNRKNMYINCDCEFKVNK